MFQVTAPIAGIIAKINVKEGDQIREGDVVALVQCMKTEIPVAAETGGVVSAIKVQEGDEIDLGDVILEVS